MNWQSAFEAGACSLAEAVAGQVHGCAVPGEDAPVAYHARALEADSMLVWQGDRIGLRASLSAMGFGFAELARVAAAGADRAFLAQLTGAGDLATARVQLSRDGTRFEAEGPDARLILAVRDADYELIDLVALSSASEDRWSLFTGFGEMLGAWHVEAAEMALMAGDRARLPMVATPWDWLRAGGEAVCVLDWSRPVIAQLRGLGPRVTIAVESPAMQARLQAMLAHGGLPAVGVADAVLGRVA